MVLNITDSLACSGSHHHDLGCQLVRGDVENITGKGIHALAMIEKLSLFDITRRQLFNLMQIRLDHRTILCSA